MSGDDSSGDRGPVPPGEAGKRRHKDIQAQLKATRADFERQVNATRADIERQVHEGKARLDQANERIEARTGRNLILAILIGLVLGALVLTSLIVVKELFVVFGAIAVAFTTFELVKALQNSGRRIDLVPALISAVGIAGTAFFVDAPTRWAVLVAGIALIVVWRLVAQMVSAEHVAAIDVVKDLMAGVFVQAYIPFFASFAISLVAQENGQWWVLAFVILVVTVDVGAYASGLSFGKHPMAPLISPNKTWEGFAGAAVASVIAGVLLAMFMLHQPWWVGVVCGLVLLGTATMGDLTESMIKRDMGIKDMSSWLPGHGGFLDRLDSILPSAAAAFALYYVFT